MKQPAPSYPGSNMGGFSARLCLSSSSTRLPWAAVRGWAKQSYVNNRNWSKSDLICLYLFLAVIDLNETVHKLVNEVLTQWTSCNFLVTTLIMQYNFVTYKESTRWLLERSGSGRKMGSINTVMRVCDWHSHVSVDISHLWLILLSYTSWLRMAIIQLIQV